MVLLQVPPQFTHVVHASDSQAGLGGSRRPRSHFWQKMLALGWDTGASPCVFSSPSRLGRLSYLVVSGKQSKRVKAETGSHLPFLTGQSNSQSQLRFSGPGNRGIL